MWAAAEISAQIKRSRFAWHRELIERVARVAPAANAFVIDSLCSQRTFIPVESKKGFSRPHSVRGRCINFHHTEGADAALGPPLVPERANTMHTCNSAAAAAAGINHRPGITQLLHASAANNR